MTNQVVIYEITRPNTEIPWAHEYIINNKDASLNEVYNQYLILRAESDGRNGWKSEYANEDKTAMLLKVTYNGATPESVSHVASLHYKRILPLIEKWDKWSTQYNKSQGIVKTRIDSHITPKNSILNNGDFGQIDSFSVKFQSPQ